MSLASLLHVVLRWAAGSSEGVGVPGGRSGPAFGGWLPPREVVSLLMLQLVHGPDYLVYAAAAVS